MNTVFSKSFFELGFTFIFDYILAVHNTCMKTNETILEFLVPVVESTHNKIFETFETKMVYKYRLYGLKFTI